jgi:hypothetical protein
MAKGSENAFNVVLVLQSNMLLDNCDRAERVSSLPGIDALATCTSARRCENWEARRSNITLCSPLSERVLRGGVQSQIAGAIERRF